MHTETLHACTHNVIMDYKTGQKSFNDGGK